MLDGGGRMSEKIKLIEDKSKEVKQLEPSTFRYVTNDLPLLNGSFSMDLGTNDRTVALLYYMDGDELIVREVSAEEFYK